MERLSNKFYWELDPVKLVEKNENFLFNLFCSSCYQQVYTQISTLAEIYRIESKSIKDLIQEINAENFYMTIRSIFEKEALLSEIYFYLMEYDWDCSKEDFTEDILQVVKRDYLSDYCWKIENTSETDYPKLLIETILQK